MFWDIIKNILSGNTQAKTITIPPPVLYHKVGGQVVEGLKIKPEIKKKIKELKTFIKWENTTRNHDYWYVLYPKQLVEQKIKEIPLPHQIRGYSNAFKLRKTDVDNNYTNDPWNCDDAAFERRYWLRLMLPGCLCFLVCGRTITPNYAHAFGGVLTKEKEIIWIGIGNNKEPKYEKFYNLYM